MYKVAKSTTRGECECSCQLPVTVIVSRGAAIKKADDLARAKTEVETLSPEITILNVD